jgi:hypothetical protein
VRRAVWSIVVLAAGAACGSARSQGEPPEAVPVAAKSAPTPIDGGSPADPPASAAGRRWIAGDLHMHVAPIDAREGQSLTIADLASMGPAAGLEFVIATPHVHPSTWSVPAKRRAWIARWVDLAAAARAVQGFTIIPGTEYTVWGFGHFGVSGVDLAALGDDFLADASARGAFVVVNHPFAEPTHIPGIPISDRDLSFRPWTDRGASPHLDGVEVWNFPLVLANLATRHGGLTGEQRAFAAADELARRERRHIAITGGSDSHRRHMLPSTWVLAADAREPTILAALRAGATCVGGPEAGTLEARGDGDAPGRWAAIGDTALARATVELRWSGRGRLFVDGRDAGEHDGTFTHDGAGGAHTYRLEQGRSHCGFVYANF